MIVPTCSQRLKKIYVYIFTVVALIVTVHWLLSAVASLVEDCGL